LAPVEVAALLRRTRDMATDPQVSDEARQLVPVLLSRLPGKVSGPVTSGLRRAGGEPIGGHPLGVRRTQPTAVADVVVARLAAAATGRLTRDLPAADPMLSVLLDEMLFSADPGTRLDAGLLIAATPYRRPVATALADELSAAVCRDAVQVVTLLTAVGALGWCPNRTVIERLVLEPSVSPAVNEAAARALGLLTGRSADAFWTVAVQRHLTAWRRSGSTTSLTTLRRLVQALGVADERRQLTRLSRDPAVPPPIRTTAGWWLTVDAATRSSAAG
jgi:hypothetical protein